MQRNHRLASAIANAAWSEFFRQLEYKAAWRGRTVIRIPTFYPSSQVCSCCGYQNKEAKDLKVRVWTCPNCGVRHRRDENAAKNILAAGLAAA